MATDKKSDYYTGAEGYTDLDGQSKQFTYIDHDIKSKVSFHDDSPEAMEKVNKEIKTRLEEIIQEILQFPAIYAAYPEDDMLKAHLYNEIIDSTDGVKWDEKILREVCEIDREFAATLHNRLWKQYIKPDHQNEEPTHEEMMTGKWKEWI